MSRTGPRGVPTALQSLVLALLLAFGALATPALRAPGTTEVGRFASAAHTHVVGATGQQGERVRAVLTSAHRQGATSGGPDGAEAAAVGGLTIVLAVLGLAVVLVLRPVRHRGPVARGRAPPGRTCRRPS